MAPKALHAALCAALMFGSALSLAACGNTEKKNGQPLARVNGTEIALTQVHKELRRAGIRPELQDAASRQLLESLIDRQLILAEAIRNKIDRDTDVVQKIERAKTQIITQAYLQRLNTRITKPSADEIDSFYLKHQEYFTQRKQFDVQQIVIATRDFDNELKLVTDSANSLYEIEAWLDQHDVRYVRGQLSRSSADLPEQMVAKLKKMRKGQMFIVNEGESTLINRIADVRFEPITAKIAAPQIEQYLLDERINEATEAEIARLRASAKIEYLDTPALAIR